MPLIVRPRGIVLALCAMTLATSAGAVPDLSTRRSVEGIVVFADDRAPGIYYVAPRDLRLVTGADGRPDLSLLDIRYTGSALSADRGLILHKSLLTVRVQLPSWTADDLSRCALALAEGGRTPELRPLPIRRIEAALIYSPIGASADTVPREVPGGRFQGSRNREGPAGESYWSERAFTAGLDSLTAQMMRSAFEQGQLSMSLGFAFIADGRIAAEPWGDVEGPRELAAALERALVAPAANDPAGRDSLLRRVAGVGAIPIRVDVRRWPDLLRRVDIDAAEGFPALDVYCYDFRDQRRPDLYEKQLEIEAETVGGPPIRLQAAFARAHSDVYSVSIQFPVAVRLDRPYRYRVTELWPDGTSRQGRWSNGGSWVGLLDVTTPATPAGRGTRPIR